MKTKLSLAIIFFFSVLNTFAQKDFPKGSILLGGSFSFSTGENDNPVNAEYSNHYTYYSIMPAAGYAIKNNLFAGVNLGYAHSKNRYMYTSPFLTDSGTSNRYSYGVFLRKYKPLKFNFSIFLQADLGAYNSTDKTTYYSSSHGNYSAHGFGINAGLTPGISYSVSSRLQIETTLNNIVGIGYSQSKMHAVTAEVNNSKATDFRVYTNLDNFSSQLSFGFRLLLQKSPKSSI